MIVLAIDIGLTGALAAVDNRGTARVRDLPLTADGEPVKRKANVKGEKPTITQPMRIDGRALLYAMREFVPAGESAIVVIEDVKPRPMGNGGAHGNTMHSQGSLMRSRGIVEAVVDISRLTLHAVQPQAWQKHFALNVLKRAADEKPAEFVSRKKAHARGLAIERFPALAEQLRLVKHHNRSDALLLAVFGQAAFT